MILRSNASYPLSYGDMYNLTEFYKVQDYRTADTILGVIYLLCFLFGLPANILSLLYFTRQRIKCMDLPNYLYTLASFQDAIISLLSLNHGMTMLRYRDVWLPGFCATHHILFQMSQRMSVFLVATLSVTRTYTLLVPLKRIKPKSVLKLLAVLWVLMTCFFVIPPSIKLVQITYHWESGYCWAEPIPGKNITYTWDELDNTMDTIGLACPVLPITLSCFISAVKIKASVPSQGSTNLKHNRHPSTDKTIQEFSMSIRKSNRKATVTIIIVTILYIIANLPLFINYVLYLVTIKSFTYPGPVYSSPVMYYYSWNFTALLTTGLNATANPIVYLTRFKRFRTWLREGCLTSERARRQSAITMHSAGRRSVISMAPTRRFTVSSPVTQGQPNIAAVYADVVLNPAVQETTA